MKFPSYPVEGTPITAEWARRLVDYLRSIRLSPGPHYELHQGAGGVTLKIRSQRGPAAGGFTGDGWIGRSYVTGYNVDSEKPWVVVDLDNNSAEERLGPPANPCPDNEVWFKKSATPGDFRVDRVG